MKREKSPKEQEAEWLKEWEAKNGDLKGHRLRANAIEPAPKPVATLKEAGPRPGSASADLLKIAKGLGKTFSLSELIVACWKYYPSQFCLPGYIYYPDSSKVRAIIYGSRGLIRRRFLRKSENGLLEHVKQP